jgi:hypothetical protein
MVRQLLGVALLTLVAGACSSAPLDPAGEQSSHVNEGDVGSVSIPLTTKNGDVAYRLNLATFTITGPALGPKPRIIKPLADVAVHTEVLPVGSYSIQLEKGWILEKMGPAEKAFTAVGAQLVTPNPTTFDVTGKVVADAFFGFVTTNGDVALGSGSVNVRIGVQDCTAYDSYTAQLGALTADCLGTLDPRAYGVSKDGFLTPNFDVCRDGTKDKLVKIRQLLSLQQRTARLPFAKQCMAGRFEVAQAKFANSGVTSCPEWKKIRDVNPITVDTIVKVEAGLPELPAADTGQPLRVLELLKQNSLYSVSSQATGQKCETPAQCATICAAAFPGFVIGTSDANTLLTDPIAWLLDTTYDKATSDPYLRATYYHAMSYYGGAPGVVFGDPVRAQPCIDGVECPPELCSYYAGSHIKTRMQLDCLVPDDPETCASYCGPPLP